MHRISKSRIAAALGLAVLGGTAATAFAVSATAADGGAAPAPARHGSASRVADHEPSTATTRPGTPSGASMSSPYIPGVPHVPADVRLVLGPNGSEQGAKLVNPDGSPWQGSGK